MDKLLRNLLIVLAVMIIAVPTGLLAVGTAYGEWDIGLSSTWAAPIPDYTLPSLEESFLNQSLAYWLSAILGVVLSGGLLILTGRAITSRN